jgi:hypothetical protein
MPNKAIAKTDSALPLAGVSKENELKSDKRESKMTENANFLAVAWLKTVSLVVYCCRVLVVLIGFLRVCDVW